MDGGMSWRQKISKLQWIKLPQSPKNEIWIRKEKSKPRFSNRKSESQQKLATMITHFAIPFRSKNLTYLMNLNSLNIKKNVLLQHSQKPTHFTNFPANMFLVGVRKKNRSALFRRPRTAFSKQWKSKCLHIPEYFRKKFLSDGGLNNLLKATHCLRLVKCFKIFQFKQKFWKFNYISAFWYFHQ